MKLNAEMFSLLLIRSLEVFIYSVSNWNTPHILDMRSGASLIVQAENHFLTVDISQGVQVSSFPLKIRRRLHLSVDA